MRRMSLNPQPGTAERVQRGVFENQWAKWRDHDQVLTSSEAIEGDKLPIDAGWRLRSSQ